MITRFFKDIFKKLNKKSNWEIQVLAIFPMKDNVVYRNTYQGKWWVAYLKIRFRALLKDLATSGEYYGIGWRIKEQKTSNL